MWTWNGSNCASSLELFSLCMSGRGELVAGPTSVLLQSTRHWRLLTTLLWHSVNGFSFTSQRESLTAMILIWISQIWDADNAAPPLMFLLITAILTGYTITEFRTSISGTHHSFQVFQKAWNLGEINIIFPPSREEQEERSYVLLIFTACSYLSISPYIYRKNSCYTYRYRYKFHCHTNACGFYNLYITWAALNIEQTYFKL